MSASTYNGHIDLSNEVYTSFISFLAEQESWSRDKILEWQLSKLDQLVKFAWQNLDGYKRHYAEHGISKPNIQDFSDFEKLPLISKAEMRDCIDDFSIKRDKKGYVTTGGSTGLQFGFYRSAKAFGKELAAKAFQYYRHGWKEGDKQIVLRGTKVENGAQFFPKFNELRFSSYDLTDEYCHEMLRMIEEFQPKWLRCYPSSAELFANWLIKNDKVLPGLSGLLCASENLYESQLLKFKKAFSGKVFSHYGQFEQVALAGYCEHTSHYHVLPGYSYVELLDKNNQNVKKAGQLGHIVGTSFTMDDTLFIRYKTEDFAKHEVDSCDLCKRPYSIWSKVEGRLQDFVLAYDGRPVSMTAFNLHDQTLEKLTQYRFHQQKLGELEFLYTAPFALSASDEARISHAIHNRLGPGFKIQLRQAKNIPLTPRGKHRFLVQELPVSFGDGENYSLFSKV